MRTVANQRNEIGAEQIVTHLVREEPGEQSNCGAHGHESEAVREVTVVLDSEERVARTANEHVEIGGHRAECSQPSHGSSGEFGSP